MSNYQQQMQEMVTLHQRIFIADTARVIGKVELEDDVSVWFGAVLRGDLNYIKIGKRTNLQENVVVHVDFENPVIIGEDNIIGPGAIVHGATIGSYNLIGMRSTILNGAQIGNYCVIGAHALVTENMVIPDCSMVLGAPGKVTKVLPLEYVKNGVMIGVEEYLKEKNKFLGI